MKDDSPQCLYLQTDEQKPPIVVNQQPTEYPITHMRRLDDAGFHRAVVLDTVLIHEDLQLIRFQDLTTAAFKPAEVRPVPALPAMMSRRKHRSYGHRLLPLAGPIPSHRIEFPFDITELTELVGSADGILRTEISHLPLTNEQADLIKRSTRIADELDLDTYDRLLIFVDGSSDPIHRHHDIAFVNEFGKSDAWAYAVVGEKYGEGQDGELTLLGWTSQTVSYESDLHSYTGVDHAGADVAERDALIWAGLWRLAQDTDIPTVFCFDSVAAGYFASGHYGSPQPSQQHRLLRGIFQSLESMIGLDHFGMHHVHGHCGLLWNELVDAAARFNAETVCFHPRQNIDIPKWRPVLHHLWMLFTDDSAPKLQEGGLNIAPPSLPSEVRTTSQCFPHGTSVGPGVHGELMASFATANVRTLSTGPTGCRGKIDYLQSQFSAFGLTIVGLQETRTEQKLIRSRRQPYTRYCSGHDRGHHGVELWLSTTQPLGYIDGKPIYIEPQNVVVLHKDPRRLIARIESRLEPICVAVLHGPQSGIEEQIRTEWWEETTKLCQGCDSSRLFLLCDANAASGPQDDVIVFNFGDDTTPNTQPFIDALRHLDLCLPATDEAHQGSHDTWISPDGKTARRIDFVCIPQEMRTNVKHSMVLQEIDLGNGESDHSVVGVQLHWYGTSTRTSAMKNAPKFDVTQIKKMTSHTVKTHLQQKASWHEDIETQVDLFNSQTHELLRKHCAHQVEGAKKPFFTEELWDLRKQKLKCRRSVKTIHRVQRQELLATVFQRWRCTTKTHPPTDFDAAWNYGCSLMAFQLRATAGLHCSNCQLRRAIGKGKEQHVQRHIDALTPNASASDILHGLRPIMGSSNQRKRKGASLPCVIDAEGEPCRTAKELQDRWIEFFGNMEGGERIGEQEQRDRWRQGLQMESTRELQLPLEELPTLYDLECSYRHVSLDKATGHDSIPGELCHRFPSACAAATFTHLLHLYLHGQEALVHKGGKLVTAYKKGNRDLCSSYRSLLISSHVGKSLHRTLRQTQNHLYAAFMHSQQLGGRQRTPVGFALHMCRAYQRHQRQIGNCCGFLFLDLTEAYYRVLRPLALGGEWTDQTVAKMAARLNLDKDALQELYGQLTSPHALDLARVPAHHQRYLRALHRDTYFYMGLQEDVCRTEIGSRPGDSFADVVFGFLWARLLRSLEKEAVSLGVVATVPGITCKGLKGELMEQEKPFLGPTWCDDLCLVFNAELATDLVKKISTTASCLFDACETLAMSPNLAPGKTEVLLCLQGRGSREAKRTYFAVDRGGWMDVICSRQSVRIHVTGEYQHLGGILHHQGDQRREAKRRIAMGHATFTTHRKLLLRNSNFTLQRRLQLFQSLILSQVTFGMETWTLRTRSTQISLHNSIMKLYKRLLDYQKDDHVGDDDILSKLEALSPTVLLRTVRLRYLGLLYRNGGEDLWALVLQDEEWKELIWADIRWMYGQLWNSSGLTDPDQNFDAWEHILASSPSYWKKLVRRAGLHSAKQQAVHYNVLQGHRRLGAHLEEHGKLRRPTPVQAHQRTDEEAYGCMQCQRPCRTRAGEGAHMFKAHQEVNPVRALFDTATCGHCLRHYQTPVRLGAHLKTSTECRQHLVGLGQYNPPLPGAGSKIHQEQAKIHDGLLPHQRCAGPQQERGRRDDFHHYSPSLYVTLAEYFVDDTATTMEQAVEGMRRLIQNTAVSWSTCKQTLRKLQEDLQTTDFEDLSLTMSDAHAALGRLQRADEWPFLKHLCIEADPEDLNYWERILQDEAPWTRSTPIFRQIGKDRFILHAFSGRRRQGDFEFYLRRMPTVEGVRIHVVSLDVVIDGTYGDLMKEETRTLWLDAIKSRWVQGFIGGPPCETWSRARGKALVGCRAAPRVLRSEEALWGKPSLGLRELRQIDFGNTLVLFCLEAIVLLLIYGGFGLMEHPAQPGEQHLASVWKLPIVAFLEKFADVRLVNVDQGLYGAKSRKPTTLLVLRLPSIVQELGIGQQHAPISLWPLLLAWVRMGILPPRDLKNIPRPYATRWVPAFTQLSWNILSRPPPRRNLLRLLSAFAESWSQGTTANTWAKISTADAS